ncbi:MAG: isoprenylcysteine carboxylmethyltransferase family protein [Gammaproteobacteria bacterium]|nr:isoprenylcysteine carboxylmethyltransferase family protein [Gammaproteobacteria bacterium]MBU1480820.1 isoprenylcysteine carboxylmethyltransferase family protein [Gammaproteobacteria bacterium]
MLEWLAFFTGTVFLTYVSRNSLRIPKSHGFYRFFAWELMLVMIVLNMDGWYSAPLTLDQTVCGILMGISLLLVIVSYESLRQYGKQDDKRSDPHLLPFEKTTELVTSGIYRFIRHPMYSSLIFLDWGLFFKRMSWLSASLASIACIFLVIATLAEENENIRYFGTKYREYMKRSKRFVPFAL